MSLPTLAKVEDDIERLKLEFAIAGYEAIAQGNMLGQRLEREGRIDDAIAQYQTLLSVNVDTPFTYRRLAILHKKLGQTEAEISAIKAALRNLPARNSDDLKWFQDRLDKIAAKKRRK